VTFAELDAHPALQSALSARGYAEPTPVQAAVLEAGHRGRDLLVSSRTGSGKTVAFGLCLAETLLGEAPRFTAGGPPLALVIAPTRELAVQVQRELAWLLGPAAGIVLSCVGGMDPRRESRALASGVHVVVGTPGRLVDHIERGALDLSALGVLVLDEADEMLDMGFREELEAILSAAPPDRRTILFSATLPKPITDLARQYTREPVRVAATPPREAHADITYRAHVVAQRERDHAIVNVLRFLDPARAMVFRARREQVTHTAAALAERGFESVAISGELSQAERIRALKSLRDGHARILVATDVASRGLDLPGVDLVLHADLPNDAAALQHRSGRTGRAGNKGEAVLLCAPPERYKLERMLRETSVAVTWSPVPPAEAIRVKDDAKLQAEVEGALTEATDEERAAAKALAEGREPEALALALLRRHRTALPAAEELPETARAADQAPRGPRPARAGPPARGAWFRLTIGREKKADPKWILPLLCRRGGVTRTEIGKIVIMANETRFEVAEGVAARFAEQAGVPDPRAPGLRIEPSRPPTEARQAYASPASRPARPPSHDAEPRLAAPPAPDRAAHDRAAEVASPAPAVRTGDGHRSGDAPAARKPWRPKSVGGAAAGGKGAGKPHARPAYRRKPGHGE